MNLFLYKHTFFYMNQSINYVLKVLKLRNLQKVKLVNLASERLGKYISKKSIQVKRKHKYISKNISKLF